MNNENQQLLESYLQLIYISDSNGGNTISFYTAKGVDTSMQNPTSVLQHKGNRNKAFYEKRQIQKIDNVINIPLLYNVKQGEINGKFLNDWMINKEVKNIFIGGFNVGDYGINFTNCRLVNKTDSDNLNNGYFTQNITIEAEDRTEDQVGLILNYSIEVRHKNKIMKGSSIINATLIT